MLVAFLDKWKTEKSFLQPQMCALVLVVTCQLQLHVNIVDKVNCPLAWSWTFHIPWQDAPEGCNMQVTTAKGDERSMCIRCYYIRRGSFVSMKQHELLSLLQTCPPLKTKSFEFDQFYFLQFFPSTSLLQTAKSSIRFFSESFAFLNFAGSILVNKGPFQAKPWKLEQPAQVRLPSKAPRSSDGTQPSCQASPWDRRCEAFHSPEDQ